MKSMTGFGRGSTTGENFAVGVELKTVNNRYLDISLRLGNELQPYESALKKKISDRLARGRVEVNIQYETTTEVSYELNKPLIAGYISALNDLKTEFGMTGEPDLNLIARLPNALLQRKEEIGESFEQGLYETLETALDGLEEMRAAEGMSLKADLAGLLSAIETSIPAVEAECENVAAEYQEKLEKRIGILLSKSDSQIEIDQARLAQEVAYIADKNDISEEISRLKSHIDQFRTIMEEDIPVGKRLDFLTQELNREANTIASKTQNLTIKEAALNMKAEIEKIREQIQNVE